MSRAIVYGLLAGILLALASGRLPFNETECLNICRAEPSASMTYAACRENGVQDLSWQKRVSRVVSLIGFVLITIGIFCAFVIWKNIFNLLKKFFSNENHFAPLDLTRRTFEKINQADLEELKVYRQQMCRPYGVLQRLH